MAFFKYSTLININNIYLRLLFYLFVWNLYLFFMSINSPLGTDWLPWHSQRIFNFSEYLNINGFFYNYGFSIWEQDINLSFQPENFKNSIYLGANLLSHLPYVLLNKFFGENSLREYGHLIDKTIILSTGILIIELFIKLKPKKISSNNYQLQILLIFILFVVNPWTYKMILASWTLIFFIFFFLLGLLMFLSKKNNVGVLFFFIAGLIDYQISAGLFVYYSFFLIYYKINKNIKSYRNFFPNISRKKNIEYQIIISFVLPIFIFYFSRSLVSNDFNTETSLLLSRIGISGNDIHNGGIVGSLQFLGGNRITQCLINLNSDLNSIPLDSKIYIFNCSLSILSMFLISLVSIFGLFSVNTNANKLFNFVILPFLFLLISHTFILQQSSSVHLMGYSYYFSIIFSFGLSSFIFKILERFKYSLSSIILTIPIILGVIILFIRVSMLTGLNG